VPVPMPVLPDAQDGVPGPAARDQVCELLRAWSDGDGSALERLTPIAIAISPDAGQNIPAYYGCGVLSVSVGWQTPNRRFARR
jgi:hypothetical protein